MRSKRKEKANNKSSTIIEKRRKEKREEKDEGRKKKNLEGWEDFDKARGLESRGKKVGAAQKVCGRTETHAGKEQMAWERFLGVAQQDRFLVDVVAGYSFPKHKPCRRAVLREPPDD